MPYADLEKRKECKRKYRESHPESGKVARRLWQIANKEKMLAATRKWRAAHPETVKANNKKWIETHRADAYQYKRQRRAKQSNTIATLTKEQAEQLYAAGCMFCGSHENLTIAHDNPVSNGGNTTLGNCFCLCQPCNSKMHTKSLSDVLKQIFLPLL
jgi:5-methylcytosine-specific restriction endonuclease McrA